MIIAIFNSDIFSNDFTEPSGNFYGRTRLKIL